jgi:uncharacterized membrane protein
MTLLKASGLCALASVLSYVSVIIRGDLSCPGALSECLSGMFFLFGLAALLCFVLAVVRRKQRASSN